MVQSIRIGFVGAGEIVRTRHLPRLQNIVGVEFVSVCNSTPESSERVAQGFGMRKVFTDWRELVHDADIDAVWIGTWPYLHCPVTLEALSAGKHVFCQARMAMNLSEARAMLEAARNSTQVTMLCPPPMGLKGDLVVRQFIEDGVLGQIYSIHFRDLSPIFFDPSTPLHWRQQEELSGLNALTVGIYAEVIHRWFGYACRVTAQTKIFIPERLNEDGHMAPVTRPDIVIALIEMENGALLRCEWSGLVPLHPIRVLEAFGSGGALSYDFADDQIFLARAGQNWEPVPIRPELERSWTVEQDFIDAIRTGKEVHPNFEDGMKYMELTEAIFRSADSGQTLSLPL